MKLVESQSMIVSIQIGGNLNVRVGIGKKKVFAELSVFMRNNFHTTSSDCIKLSKGEKKEKRTEA